MIFSHCGSDELEEGAAHGCVAACAPLEMEDLVFDQSCAVFATVLAALVPGSDACAQARKKWMHKT